MATSPLFRALTGYPAVQEPRDAPRATQVTVINIRERLRRIEEQVNLLISSWRLEEDEGFPDAPSDGYIYGRRNRTWTRVGGQPAPPFLSVQWNNSGQFGGSSEFLFDLNNRLVVLGATSGPTTALETWTIKPRELSGNGGSYNGISLAIEGGDVADTVVGAPTGGHVTLRGGSCSVGAPGNVYLYGGDSSVSGISAGDIYLTGGHHSRSGGTFGQDGGLIAITGGMSAQEDGGNVTIDGGYGYNASVGSGGIVTIRGGRGANTGGALLLIGGQSDGNPGANVSISGGSGGANGNGVVTFGTMLQPMKSGTTTIRGAPIRFQTTGATTPASPSEGDFWGLSDGLYYRTATGTIAWTTSMTSGVSALNSLVGDVTLQAGAGITITTLSGNVLEFSANFAGVVASLNGMTGDVTLQAGTNVTITPQSGNVLVIDASGSGGGVTSLNGLTDAIVLQGGGGTTVSIESGNVLRITSTGSGGGVDSLNSLTGDVTLTAGPNITLTPQSGNVIEIDASSALGELLVDDDYGILFDDSGDVIYED